MTLTQLFGYQSSYYHKKYSNFARLRKQKNICDNEFDIS